MATHATYLFSIPLYTRARAHNLLSFFFIFLIKERKKDRLLGCVSRYVFDNKEKTAQPIP